MLGMDHDPRSCPTRASTGFTGLMFECSLISFWDFLDDLFHDALSDALV